MTHHYASPNYIEHARRSLPLVNNRIPSRDVIARRLGVSVRTVAGWERNESCPQKRLIPRLAQVLNVSIAELGSAIAIMQAQQGKGRAA